MADRIKCVSCGAESYNEFGITRLYCHVCFTGMQEKNKENRYKMELSELKAGYYWVVYEHEIRIVEVSGNSPLFQTNFWPYNERIYPSNILRWIKPVEELNSKEWESLFPF
jgi:hypothetical protein